MQKYYTMGEFAGLSGVSYKTVRYYLDKKLLEPAKISESGYRLFDEDSMERMQKILMLKYLNFSVDEIKNMLEENSELAFEMQEQMLIAEKEHIEQVLTAVREIQKIPEESKWDGILSITKMTAQKEEIRAQYRKQDNLQKRINIHQFSTSKEEWFDWLFKRMNLEPGMKILEIGCGNGRLWESVCSKLPSNLNICLTDNSEGMLKEAKERLDKISHCLIEKNITVSFMKMDAENLYVKEKGFDCIVANHVLYHIADENRPGLFEKCKKSLKENGVLIASTVGETHFKELFEFMENYDKKFNIPYWMKSGFTLENGKKQLEKVFDKVYMEEQENDLFVTSPEAVYDYMFSLPGNVKDIIKKDEANLRQVLRLKISEKTPFFIHKSSGVFICR